MKYAVMFGLALAALSQSATSHATSTFIPVVGCSTGDGSYNISVNLYEGPPVFGVHRSGPQTYDVTITTASDGFVVGQYVVARRGGLNSGFSTSEDLLDTQTDGKEFSLVYPTVNHDFIVKAVLRDGTTIAYGGDLDVTGSLSCTQPSHAF